MIVRILGEDQYRLDDAHLSAITKLDNDLEKAAAQADEGQFSALLDQLVSFIREQGKVVPYDELAPSQLLIPPPDMSMAEARKYFEENEL
ncbi:MAG TPA: hypothetical protein VH599_01015 [Ktedonobacterales bacterium]|jgi:hypothetical protein